MFPLENVWHRQHCKIFLYFLRQSFTNKVVCREDEAFQKGENYSWIYSFYVRMTYENTLREKDVKFSTFY